MDPTHEKSGRVMLIGAGPGDPSLLTLEGRRACEGADVIYYDRLARPVLESIELKPGAEAICVGKMPGQHGASQDEITRLLIEAAGRGRVVARLKGGDPFLFGRGGEEAEALREAGIEVVAVPGISAFQAIAPALGIPLTHREVGSALHIWTGHDLESMDADSSRAWIAEADALRAGGTLILYMGMSRLAGLTQRLMASGCPRWMPAAIVASATLPGETILRARLVNLAEAAAAKDLQAPAIIVVGRILLHGWRDKAARTASPDLVAVGHEAGCFYGGDDFAALEGGEAAQIVTGRVVANDSLLASVGAASAIQRIDVADVAGAVALAAGMRRANILPGDLAHVEIAAADSEVAAALANIVGVRATADAEASVPCRSCQISLRRDKSSAGDGGPEIRTLRLRVESPRLRPERLSEAAALIAEPTVRAVIVGDVHSAMALLDALRAAHARGAALHARPGETAAFLSAQGLQSHAAHRLYPILHPESSCATLTT